MKLTKFLSGITLATVVILGTACWFYDVNPFEETITMPNKDPDFAYELDTWGSNSEVYEFTPEGNPSLSIIMLMLDNGKAVSTFTIPKGKKADLKRLLRPDSDYELDTWMENSEVYEFTPRSNKDWTCNVYILDSLKDMSMSCFQKLKKEESAGMNKTKIAPEFSTKVN